MATFPKIDLASEFPNTTHGVDFRWIEDRVREGLSDEQIIEKFKEWDPYWTEESMQFVRWVLYYFSLMQCRDVVPEQENSASQKLKEIEQIAHEEYFEIAGNTGTYIFQGSAADRGIYYRIL